MNRSEVSSKWNKCRIYVGDQLVRSQGSATCPNSRCCSIDVKICVCLPHKYGRFMLFIDNNLLLSGARLHILKIKIDLASLRSVHN
jgi:hypothetical protein